jgi:cytidylate kinase
MLRIAIDGTASAGKGSIAKGVAKALDIAYVDTGAMYRSIALLVMETDGDCNNVECVLSVLEAVAFDFKWDGEGLGVWLNGRNVTELIRTKEVGAMASVVSVHLPVRKRLSEIQRQYANSESLVMDGRDIGTVIIPDAELKVFVDAEVMVRAERRCLELQSKGEVVSVEVIAADLSERDHRDRNREIAPLKCAEDAQILDTTHLTIDEGSRKILVWASAVAD